MPRSVLRGRDVFGAGDGPGEGIRRPEGLPARPLVRPYRGGGGREPFRARSCGAGALGLPDPRPRINGNWPGSLPPYILVEEGIARGVACLPEVPLPACGQGGGRDAAQEGDALLGGAAVAGARLSAGGTAFSRNR